MCSCRGQGVVRVDVTRYRIGLSVSSQKWNPSRFHCPHIRCILGIAAQEVFLHQALNGDEPENAESNEQSVEWTECSQQESTVCQQYCCVHGMAHKRICATTD